MQVIVAADDPRSVDADVLVVPVFKGGIEGPGAEPVLSALGLESFPVTPDFRGDIDQSLLLAAPGLACRAVLLIGLGRMDAVDAARLRHAAGVAAKAVAGFERVATTLAEVHATTTAVAAVAEGFLLGGYTYRAQRSDQTKDAPKLREVAVLVPSSRLADAGSALERAEVYARATAAARDLVNRSPDLKQPPALAEALRGLVEGTCEVRVLDEAALADEGFGAILAVGRGSSGPPHLVEIRYRPDNPLGSVALVGKGITFDTGGLSKKSTEDMTDMKSDMAGAAAVAAACSVLGDLDVRLEVTALLPLAENAVGGDAQRPGDIIRSYSGKTIEVRDTDAEGRLVLADALAYAARFSPDAIVDLATLTGSAIRAVGQYAAGLLGTDGELLDSLEQAAAVAGEPLWRLPLWDELDRHLDSPVADMNNTGDGAGAGATMGALFLRRFVGETPWAHLDIAGPAFLPKKLARGHLTPGGTGYGVRTLLAWLERRVA